MMPWMIGAGALVMAALRDPDPFAVAFIVSALSVVALLVAAAGWLLEDRPRSKQNSTSSSSDCLLVLGGAAAYLGMSALIAGLVVGTAWNVAGDVAKTRITRDLYYFQHPLVVLVLIVAGGACDAVDRRLCAGRRDHCRSRDRTQDRRLARGAIPGGYRPARIADRRRSHRDRHRDRHLPGRSRHRI